MTDVKREIERKYESEGGALPDLTGTAGVAEAVGRGVVTLDATYYDTADRRLAAASLTLRRRTGGEDAGWHLKVPVAPGVRDEIRAPLSDTVPDHLAALVRARVRATPLVPLVRLRSAREVTHLLDARGTLLAEASVDTVTAHLLTGGSGDARSGGGAGAEVHWTEIEVELADGADPRVLDKLDKRLRKAGVRPARSASKLAHALELTGAAPHRPAARRARPVTAGDHVLAYVRAHREALLAHDPGVRRDVPDAVHRMRVATRRLRSTFRSFGTVLDPAVTGPLAAELKWLAGELGADRDQEVLTARLEAALGAVPSALVLGPVRERIAAWSGARHGSAHGHLLAILDSARYLGLLDAVDALLADPPLRGKGARQPGPVLAGAVAKDLRAIDRHLTEALELPPGAGRDTALHEARKKAKRARYAAEAAVPALGRPARRLAKALKKLTGGLGEHQDAVMARRTLRELAAVAHAAGESAFTYGLLYGREEERSARAEARAPELWGKVSGRAAAL
ncbi:CYTH and CHAD domain-containing protein [Streptomyces sp. J2-1]|uniref:CYTH and CHAD domain-containing protein n=1 Tax=Streptomyces corallincola TaxID=2851888 RepID=UPI001C3925A7|nr:CYTH and CHAD domain-containing protein [Streptomyces corallincola]MBV2356555.1 CYTH and CHAD domain-containing protein [Streptomyces corallincola]